MGSSALSKLLRDAAGQRGLFNAAGNNEDPPGSHIDRPAIGFSPADAQTSAQHKEKLVFTSMRVPWELALDTRYFYKLIVDLTHHSWRPQLGESLTLEFQRNRKLLHRERRRRKRTSRGSLRRQRFC